MKYFTIGTLALIGLAQARLDLATTAVCTGEAAENFANQQIADAGGNVSDYVIKYNNLENNNLGKFLTIMCKAAPWQHNGDVYDPYKTTKWDAVKAEEYAKYAADNVARDSWLRDHGAELGYPAGSGGKAWCGYKGDGSNNVEWHFMESTPLCPNHDDVNAWYEFYEASKNPYGPLKVWPSENAVAPSGRGYYYADFETFAQYELSFNLKINKQGGSDWRSIVHIGNINNQRFPGIWWAPGTEFVLHIMQTRCVGLDDQNQGQDGFEALETGWKEGENHHFMMRVTREGNSSKGEMRIFLDGEDKGTHGTNICDNNTFHAFWLGAPWFEKADVEYANIEYKEIQ